MLTIPKNAHTSFILLLLKVLQSKELFFQLCNLAADIDLKEVSRTLESQGVKKFQDSFASLLAAIETKA